MEPGFAIGVAYFSLGFLLPKKPVEPEIIFEMIPIGEFSSPGDISIACWRIFLDEYCAVAPQVRHLVP